MTTATALFTHVAELLEDSRVGTVPSNISSVVTYFLDLLPIGVQIDNQEHRTIFVNARFTQMLGYSLEDIAELDDWFRLAYPDPKDREQVRKDWAQQLAQAATTQSEIPALERTVTCKNGEKKVIEFYVRRVGTYYIYLNIDVSSRFQLAAELRRLAYTDALTGLGNRRQFFEVGEKMTARNRPPFAALMFDLDHFKALNDRHGHKIGDSVLVEIAARCRAVLGDERLLARLGGEEFGVLLPGCDQTAATGIAEDVRKAISDSPLRILSLNVDVTASIGGACSRRDACSIDYLMAQADKALYAAKRSGRNKVCFAGRR
jgi:diguanylate cyclase (GGDEF)-like protein